MVRRLLDRGVGEVRVLSRDEAKQDEMRRLLGDERVPLLRRGRSGLRLGAQGQPWHRLHLPRGRPQAGAVLRILPA
ncbi:hypothetical protein [Micromonospora sp. NPDC005161]